MSINRVLALEMKVDTSDVGGKGNIGWKLTRREEEEAHTVVLSVFYDMRTLWTPFYC